jgi:hypothetical protein
MSFKLDPEATIEDDIKQVEDSKKFISWIQTFSKKIVTATFILYLLHNIVVLGVALFQLYNGMMVSFDSIYTEINETFRVVIGGYLVKAGIENAFKIGGRYLIGVSDAKLSALKEKYNVESSSNNTETDEFGDTTF